MPHFHHGFYSLLHHLFLCVSSSSANRKIITTQCLFRRTTSWNSYNSRKCAWIHFFFCIFSQNLCYIWMLLTKIHKERFILNMNVWSIHLLLFLIFAKAPLLQREYCSYYSPMHTCVVLSCMCLVVLSRFCNLCCLDFCLLDLSWIFGLSAAFFWVVFTSFVSY